MLLTEKILNIITVILIYCDIVTVILQDSNCDSEDWSIVIEMQYRCVSIN